MKSYSNMRKSAYGMLALSAATAIFSSSNTMGANSTPIIHDLTPIGSQSITVTGADGTGPAKFADNFVQPAGTGVFKPFLTVDANGQTSTGNNKSEQGYNTDGFTALYLDDLRPNWNRRFQVENLANVNGYYGFLLDANEPGGAKNLISIDNVRIYTSATDNTAAVANDMSKINQLGTLRWALNSINSLGQTDPFTQYVKLDANQENVYSVSNGGSGKADMVLWVPVTAFGNAKGTDYVWFYNLNGSNVDVNTGDASTAGYEEWAAITGPIAVPDGGATAILLGIGALGVAAASRKRA